MRKKREKRKRSGYSGKEPPAQYMIDYATSTITAFDLSSLAFKPRSFSVTDISPTGEATPTMTDWDSFDWEYTWG